MTIEEYKTIFVHIPKNAGSSIENYFAKGNLKLTRQIGKHDSIYEIKKKFPDLYNSYRKFAVVRSPYDRMLSWFFFLKKWLNESGDYIVEFNKWIKNPSNFQHTIYRLIKKNVTMINKMQGYWFDDVVDEFYLGDPANFLNPQYTWIDNTVTVIKYEKLNSELNDFFGEEINLPMINKSDYDHSLNYYNEESLDIVYEKYKEDFEKFNYEKL
jgi:hypothetical protein